MNSKPKPMNAKTCKICGDRFIPLKAFTNTCSDGCKAIQLVRDREKVKKKEKSKALKQFNDSDRSILLRTAQKVFNTYIRMRDGKKCISCNYEGEGRQIHAGHYMSQGGNSALRFDENNCHSQCSICNNHLSANLVKYRPALIDKIGLDELMRLETTKNTKLWTVDELHEIIKTYKQKIKDLRED